MVRITVNLAEAAAAVPEIKRRLLDAGCEAPLIGDFHYNGHLLLTQFPECAAALDKYRINPGNVGYGRKRDEQFATIVKIAADLGKPVRIGVNGGSLNQELVMAQDAGEHRPRSRPVLRARSSTSAWCSRRCSRPSWPWSAGSRENQIIISCKVSRPPDLIAVYRELARRTRQPLHLGLTEAGMGIKGLVWSATAIGVLLAEGIGDTIRVSLTPRPGGDRREEVYAACEILQSLGIRSFAPSVTACPGCGRTTSTTFQELAERVQGHVRERMPEWKRQLRRGRGAQARGHGLRGQRPRASRRRRTSASRFPAPARRRPARSSSTARSSPRFRAPTAELAARFIRIIDDYVDTKYPRRA